MLSHMCTGDTFCMRSIHVETVCVWNINQVAIKFKFRNIIDIYPLKCQSHPSIRNVKFNHLCALKVKKKTSKYFCLLQRENIMFCIEFPPYPFYHSFGSISKHWHRNIICKCQIKPFIITAFFQTHTFFFLFRSFF